MMGASSTHYGPPPGGDAGQAGGEEARGPPGEPGHPEPDPGWRGGSSSNDHAASYSPSGSPSRSTAASPYLRPASTGHAVSYSPGTAGGPGPQPKPARASWTGQAVAPGTSGGAGAGPGRRDPRWGPASSSIGQVGRALVWGWRAGQGDNFKGLRFKVLGFGGGGQGIGQHSAL